MFTSRRLVVSSLFVLVLAGAALAQENRAPIDNPRAPVPTAPMVTVRATAKRVRFVSPGTVVQLRLEIYNETGQKLFDTELRGGNVLDWHLQDGAGERLAPGSYATVLTIKSLSGRLSQRVGRVTVSDQKAMVEGAGQLSLAQQQTIGPVEDNVAFTILQEREAEAITAVTHDGQDGQLTSTSGALTFRTGNVFAGKDKEQMRLTEAGNLGIGTNTPQAKLDVAGTIRTSKGIEFANGPDETKVTKLTTTATGSLQQTLADGTVVENATGTGTQNRVAKWIDNVGTLGDSAITELNGNVGIGLTNPAAPLHVFGSSETVRQTLSNTNSFIQFGFYEGAVKKGAFGYQGSTSAGFVGGPGAMVFGTLTGSPIAFFTNGTEKVRLDTNGNIGIGTTNPTAKLHVVGDAKVSGNLTVDMNTLFVNAANDRVGIGTNNPLAKLHVLGNANFTGLRTFENATSPNVVGGHSGNTVAGGVFGATIAGGGYIPTPGGLPFPQINNVTGRFGTIGGGAGNTAGAFGTVGGGSGNSATGEALATVSGGELNLASGIRATIGGGGSNNATAVGATIGGGNNNNATESYATVPGGFENSAGGRFSFAAGRQAKALHESTFVWADLGSPSGVNFESTAANQFLIRAAGGVGIGTNAPTAMLHVLGTSNAVEVPVAIVESTGIQVPLSFRSGATEVARIRSDSNGNLAFATLNGVGGGTRNIHFRAGDDVNTDMFIQASSGAIGIGTTTPATKLDVIGSISLDVSAGSGVPLCRAVSRQIVDCSASSARYKQNIFGLRLGLDVVRQLRPVSFTWKEDGQRDIGLVAEEVNRVEPLLATRNDKGNVEGVRYDRLGVVLLNAVQEQQSQIKVQQQQLRAKDERIANLEARFARYDARLASLDQRLPRGRTTHHARRSSKR